MLYCSKLIPMSAKRKLRVLTGKKLEKRNRLVLENERHAEIMAWTSPYLNKRNLAFEDLKQEAFVGMLRSAPEYKKNMGAKFTTFCNLWVNQCMKWAFRRQRPVAGIDRRNVYVDVFSIEKSIEITAT